MTRAIAHVHDAEWLRLAQLQRQLTLGAADDLHHQRTSLHRGVEHVLHDLAVQPPRQRRLVSRRVQVRQAVSQKVAPLAVVEAVLQQNLDRRDRPLPVRQQPLEEQQHFHHIGDGALVVGRLRFADDRVPHDVLPAIKAAPGRL
ncbi:MAG: hypothetical protein WD009_12295 [Phycisphaeraceae bacterium]